MSTIPSEDEVLIDLRVLRQTQPTLGIGKVLSKLKEQNPTWSLSEKRLKDIMKKHGLETLTPPSIPAKGASGVECWSGSNPPPERSSPRPHPKGWSVTMEAAYEKVQPLQQFILGEHLGPFDWSKMSGHKGYRLMSFVKPSARFSNALLHQLDYKANSDRIYRIYGHGEYDWGFTPNADMGIVFDEALAAVITNKDRNCLYFMYLRLLAAARQVGVSAADLRAQLHAEYGFDPLLAAPPPPSTPIEIAAWHATDEKARQEYRVKKTKALTALWNSNPQAREFIEIGQDGVPVWEEEKNGIDAVFCVPVKKQGDSWRLTK